MDHMGIIMLIYLDDIQGPKIDSRDPDRFLGLTWLSVVGANMALKNKKKEVNMVLDGYIYMFIMVDIVLPYYYLVY